MSIRLSKVAASPNMLSDPTFLITGIVLGGTASACYFLFGYNLVILVYWIASLIFTGTYFFRKRTKGKTSSSYNRLDIYTIFALLLLFLPLYTFFVSGVPYQINNDEIAIMVSEKFFTEQSSDLFGLSSNLYFPSFIFIIFGWLGRILGGINLTNMRLIHAFSGLAIIVFCYLFFRLIMPRLFATGGAMLVGSNHALLGISRMAMRDNTGLLTEIAALAFLFRGFKEKCQFYTFLGGAVAGLSFYTYYPARITIVLWCLFLVLTVFFSEKALLTVLIKLVLICILGFILAASPVILATIKASPAAFTYPRQQLLIFPEGRKLQQQWVSALTTKEGVKINIINGLTTFNNKVHDKGTYPNFNHGFVDPFTGILIWVGVLNVLFRIVIKRKPQEGDFLALAGFFLLWLAFSFLVNKSPNYTRLLVILPFVACLVVIALKNISALAVRFCQKFGPKSAPSFGNIIFAFAVIIIALWNLMIFGEFVKKGLAQGHDIGGTARYVEARRYIPNYSFYLAASKEHPYFTSDPGDPGKWKSWVDFFSGAHQKVEVVSPENFLTIAKNPPFTIFLSQKLWLRSKGTLSDLHPNLMVHNIKTDGSLVAVEIR